MSVSYSPAPDVVVPLLKAKSDCPSYRVRICRPLTIGLRSTVGGNFLPGNKELPRRRSAKH